MSSAPATASTAVLPAAVADQEQMTMASHADLIKKLRSAIAGLVRASNRVPLLGDGFELFATYPEFAHFIQAQRCRLVNLLRKLLAAGGLRSIRVNASRLEDMAPLISANDQLAERIARSMDEFQASLNTDRIRARQIQLGAEPIPGAAPHSEAAAFRQPHRDGGGRYATAFASSTSMANVVHLQLRGEGVHVLSTASAFSSGVASVSMKPQLLYQFAHCIVNLDQPFAHKLRVKHNAMERRIKGKLKLLEDTPSSSTPGSFWPSDEAMNMEEDEAVQQHPYEHELEQFSVPEGHKVVPERVQHLGELEETPCVLVQRAEGLEQLVEELNVLGEFAFDLEHHSQRSFLGLTCLVQISTRERDYLLDPFPLWECMYRLNEPFSNPNIVKVAFNCSQDIIWLQRDFGIYVLGLFDTGLAYSTLCGTNSKLSLKKMLADICHVQLDKQHQLSDWRVRPLSQSMVDYARTDTHFLLACFDHLRRELAARQNEGEEGMRTVEDIFMESLQISKQQFHQPRFDPSGYLKLAGERPLNNRQHFALRQLWLWRDQTAREQDESLYWVLPEHMLLKMAEVLPREPSGILACCSPVPALVRHELNTLSRIIAIAREMPLEAAAPLGGGENGANAENGAMYSRRLSPTPANRVVGAKAKLDFRFDISKRAKLDMLDMEQEGVEQHQAGDEHVQDHFDLAERLTERRDWIQQALAANNAREEEEKPEKKHEEKHAEKDEEKLNWRRIVVEDGIRHGGDDGKQSMDVKLDEEEDNGTEHVQRVRQRLGQLALPYECYQLALREQEEQKNQDVKPDKSKLLQAMHGAGVGQMAAEENNGRKRYSHLDEEEVVEGEEEVERVQQQQLVVVKQEEGMQNDQLEEEDEEERAFFADPANLTRKARKKVLKKAKQAADIHFK